MRHFWKTAPIIPFTAILFFNCLQLFAGDVSLAWDPSTSEGVVGYKVHYGGMPGSYNSFHTVTNQTAHTVTGLAAGTYFFAVTAFDASGNESGYSNEVSTVIEAGPSSEPVSGDLIPVGPIPVDPIPIGSSDPIPPLISSVKSTEITATGATILWSTDELSDSLVAYGTTAGYGATAAGGTMTTSHRVALSGLNPGTTYHYQVKSRDGAGNQAVSSDLTFTTVESVDRTPPVISRVVVSGQTGSEVTVSWTTNEASDSQIEYGTTSRYGSSTEIEHPTVFSHAQVLTGLEPETTYHFKVLSSDAEGNLAVSKDYTFTTMKVASTWTVPIAFSKIMTNDELFVGVAIMNDTELPQTVALTAFDGAGNMIIGDGIHNPAVLQMKADQQLSLVDVEIFGNNLSRFCSSGWIRMESTTENIRGFSSTFDGQVSLVDAVAFSSTPASNLVFTHVEPDGRTALSIINRNVASAGVTIELVRADGGIRSAVSRVVDGRTALTEDLFGELFGGLSPNPSDYIRISADRGVEAFQMIQQGSADIAYLAGRDGSEASGSLYLPRYVYSSKASRTDISVVNTSSDTANLWIRLIADNGVQIGTTRNVQIAGKGKLFIDGPEFFVDQVFTEETASGVVKGKSSSSKFNGKANGRSVGNLPSVIMGYVEIVSNGINLVGSTSYRGRNSQSFIATFPLVSRLQDKVVFSHVVSDGLFYTEMALANPGTTEASVYLDLFNGQGDRVDTFKISLPAGRQYDFSLKEVFAALKYNDQTGGHVFMSSDLPIAAFSLFGKNDQSVFSAIPTQ